MRLFGKVVQLAVNVAALPIEVAKDVVTLGNAANASFGGSRSFTGKRIEKLVDDARED